MSQLTYRRVLSAKDMAYVARLAQGIWTNHYESLIGTGQTAYMLAIYQSETAISKQILSGTIYKLIYNGADCIGYYSIEPNGRQMILGRIYLKQEARRRGFGRLILEEIRSQCAGMDEIQLAVLKANPDAVAFYQHLGFEIYGERTSRIGAGYTTEEYLMRYPLGE